jgi:hypothetical protein
MRRVYMAPTRGSLADYQERMDSMVAALPETMAAGAQHVADWLQNVTDISQNPGVVINNTAIVEALKEGGYTTLAETWRNDSWAKMVSSQNNRCGRASKL